MTKQSLSFPEKDKKSCLRCLTFPPRKGGNLIDGEAWCLLPVGDARDLGMVARLCSDIQALYQAFVVN